MTAKQNKPREVFCQAHVPQGAKRERNAVVGRDAGAIGSGSVQLRATAQARLRACCGRDEGIPEQLGSKRKASGFHKGETRDGGAFERIPGIGEPLAAPLPLPGRFQSLRTGMPQGFTHAELGGKQHWALRSADVLAKRNGLDGHAKETGEAEGFNPIGSRFQRAAEDLGAHINAEYRLHSGWCGSWLPGCQPEFSEKFALPGLLVGELPEEGRKHPQIASGILSRLQNFSHGRAVILLEQSGIVGEPHREQVQKRIIALTARAVFPHTVLHVPGPPPDAHQQAVEVIRRIGFRNTNGTHRAADGLLGVRRQRLHPLPEPAQTKHFGIEISSEQGNYKMTGFPGADFPKSPVLEDPASITIPAGTLATAINKTLFATGNDDLRPVMSGIFFELSEDAARFVATDAHKLVRYTRSDISSPKAASFIVPKKPLNLLKNSLATTNAEVNVEFNENNASFTFDNMRLVCRLIDGKYPNYEAVIPKQNPNKLTIDRQNFLNAIRRVALFSNKTTHQVRLNINGSQLAISAEDLDYANEANEKLTCSYEGEDMMIGFNSRFLVDMLVNLGSENVVMEMSAPNRAGILLPGEAGEHGEDVLMLVMPVMLNN